MLPSHHHIQIRNVRPPYQTNTTTKKQVVDLLVDSVTANWEPLTADRRFDVGLLFSKQDRFDVQSVVLRVVTLLK